VVHRGAAPAILSDSDGDITSSSDTYSSSLQRTILNSPPHYFEDEISLPSYYNKHQSISGDERLSPNQPRRLTWHESHDLERYERHHRISNREDANTLNRLQLSLDTKEQQAFGRDAKRIKTRSVSQRHVTKANKYV